MEDLSLHILDVVENSVMAGASEIRIGINEDSEKDQLAIEIEDNGSGMDEETVKKVLDPFYTTRTTRRVGLGLPLLAQAARETGGDIEVSSEVGKGTKIRVLFQRSHIDRKPMGNMEETLTTLIAGHPEIHFVYEHREDETSFRLDTDEMQKAANPGQDK